MIQQYTNTTTATNYGYEQGVHGTSIPLRNFSMNDMNGPFPRYVNWNIPSTYVLTKTHCGGTKMSPLQEYYIETTRSFETACRSGDMIINDTKYHVTYPITIPQRAIHLIRNPFDNTVARYHYTRKHWISHNMTNLLNQYNNTPQGFHDWCSSLGTTTKKEETMFYQSKFMDDELYNIVKDIPCRDEFLRYVYWHNHAIEITTKRQMPVLTLFYENYTENWIPTIHEIMDFLQLEPVTNDAIPLEFITGKHYEEEYFTFQHRNSVKQLIQELSSSQTWDLLRHYFS